MAVSMKVRESTKRRLERLQAELASLGGGDQSLQEVLDRAVRVAGEEPAKLLNPAGPALLPLSPEDTKKVLAQSFDWGFVTSKEEMRRTLYSDEALHGIRPGARSRGNKAHGRTH